MAASQAALAAAAWVVNMDNGPERSRLYNGHMIRRREVFDGGGYRATDYSEADAWLIEEWTAVGSPSIDSKGNS